jgi:cytochrome P450
MSAVLESIDIASSALGRKLIDDRFLEDPYPTYRELQEAGPIHWSDEFFGGAWLLTRHADVEMMLRDPRFSAQRTGGWVMNSGDGARSELRGLQRLFSRAMLFRDSPDHQRIRRVLHAAFRPEALQRLVPEIEVCIEALLAELDANIGFDFMQCIARPLPARVISRLLGVEDGDDERLMAWSDDLSAFIGSPCPTMEQAKQAQVAVLGMARYFEACLADGRARSDGLLWRMADACSKGEIDDGPELLAQCVMLLFAGHETTRNALGNGLYHLLSRRELWGALQREPESFPAAIRELLRFDSPVQYTGRRVAAGMVLHGQRLARGDLVVGLIGAANRDPARYEQADRVDLARRSTASLSFGSGPHVCIGAALTMIEVDAVFRQLSRRWPGLRLRESRARWNGNPVYRGLVGLEVGV